MKGIMESLSLGGLSQVWAGNIFVYFKANWKSSRSGVEAVHRQFWEGGGTLISLYFRAESCGPNQLGFKSFVVFRKSQYDVKSLLPDLQGRKYG